MSGAKGVDLAKIPDRCYVVIDTCTGERRKWGGVGLTTRRALSVRASGVCAISDYHSYVVTVETRAPGLSDRGDCRWRPSLPLPAMSRGGDVAPGGVTVERLSE